MKGQGAEHAYSYNPCLSPSSTNLPFSLFGFRCYQILNQLENFGIQKPGNQNDWIHKWELVSDIFKDMGTTPFERSPGHASPLVETDGLLGRDCPRKTASPEENVHGVYVLSTGLLEGGRWWGG